MDKIKVLVINDEGEDVQIEEDVLRDSFADPNQEIDVKYIPAGNTEEVAKELPSADGMIIVYTEFDEERLEEIQRCKVIATQTIGIDTIDLKAATEEGICITNCPDYCMEEVATHTVALALACVRKLPIYNRASREKIWNIDDIYEFGRLHRLRDRVFGLSSFGHIPKLVAKLMKAFGMKVIAFDPFLDDEVFIEHGVERVDSLEALFERSNIVSLHTPLTAETEGMVDYELISKMPEGGILLNTSRGEIVNEDDLYRALKDGTLTAAGTDVIADESTYNSKLYELDNVIITPHVAYYSEESLRECREKAAQQVGDVIGKKTLPKYLVNKDVVGKTKEELK